ncbi:HD domain-containing protein [Luminiphilus sp.]|nr:HD domain-containing protein [Luminiphilus sp.]MDB2379679.1 HD domain-containing protein [Luminiphilus sp.]MDB3899547.1 HD domain-containing protein [Luminiphilus sp.]
MTEVSFTQMKDGTQADYQMLEQLETDHIQGLPDRVMTALAALSNGLAGYKIDRLQHSLQTATRAQADGASIDWIVAALVHDIGDDLAPLSHSEFAAALLKPFVSEEIVWVIEKHGLFQAYYYAHHTGGDRHARDKYKGHLHYERCVHFCEVWDQASFDPAYPTRPLEYFEPMVREVFSRSTR